MQKSGPNKTKLKSNDDKEIAEKKSKIQQTEKPSWPNFIEIATCFKHRIISLAYHNTNKSNLLPEEFFKDLERHLPDVLKYYLYKFKAIKYNLMLYAEYSKIHVQKAVDGASSNDVDSLADKIQVDEKNFQTKMQILTDLEDFSKNFAQSTEDLVTKSQNFEDRDSGWSLVALVRIVININKYQPLKGSSYLALPELIANRKACINVKNHDYYCFKWCLLSAFANIKNNPQNTSSYRHWNIVDEKLKISENFILDFTNLEFPLKLNDILQFERQNKEITINVFGYDAESKLIIGPLYKTALCPTPKHLNLLYLQDENCINSHYVWIKNTSRLLGKQITLSHAKIYICNFCLQHFYNEAALINHTPVCSRTVSYLPNEDKSNLEFKNYQKSLKIPFVIYADFECLLEKLDVNNNDDMPSTSGAASSNQEHQTNTSQSTETPGNAKQKHVPYAFGYYIKCSYDENLDVWKIYKGYDCAKKFIEFLIADVKRIYTEHLAHIKTMAILSMEELKEYNDSAICHICEQTIETEEEKVKDHCHLTGAYRGPAHNKCNLNYKIPNFMPVFLHNFSHYDCHLFIRELNHIDDGPINVIPINKEVYLNLSKTITVNKDKKIYFELRFLDSYRFMPSNLDTLAQNLQPKQFQVMRKLYPDDEMFNLLTRKGILPYDYLDSEQKLQDKKLPTRKDFYNSLLNKECSLKDFQTAKIIWTRFGCQNLGDYLDIYLKVDVLLLTDVFENFRKICYGIYKLDPAQYYTAPGLSWDAMLKMTKIQLKLLTDMEMFYFVKRGIRGGLVQCTSRYACANNKYMKDFNSKLPNQYLVYLDANNLYGWAMSKPLPTGDFKWLPVPSVEAEYDEFLKNLNESTSGYIFEVDLIYPLEIHDAHNDLPFCSNNKIPPGGKQIKLLADLYDKMNYIVHLDNLKICLRHGLHLKRIHRVLTFQQSPWLKKYIDLNTYYRTKAENDFERDFYKLMNNSVYGKTLENVDKRKNVKIVNKWENQRKSLGARALIANPSFHSLSRLNDEMVIIQMSQTHVLYNKPIYLGFCILELSKWKMYEFHYDYMKPKYGNDHQRLCLNYMDTDSFFYTVKTDDFYEDIKTDIEDKFDTSNYAEKNPYKIPNRNAKRLGFMKDENGGRIVKEFIGLRSKMYSFQMADERRNDRTEVKCQTIKKAKGVPSSYVQNYLTFADFKRCLFNNKTFYDTIPVIKSKLHNLYTQNLKRVTLSPGDDKRFTYNVDDNQHKENRDIKSYTLAWGHFRIGLLDENTI